MRKARTKGTTPVQKEIEKQLFYTLDDPTPKSQTDRKKYVSDIAFFYSTIFKPKLKHFIGLQLEELAKLGRTEQMNDILRSNISCLRIIDEWMQTKTNEHFGNLEEVRDSFIGTREFISDINKKYKK